MEKGIDERINRGLSVMVSLQKHPPALHSLFSLSFRPRDSFRATRMPSRCYCLHHKSASLHGHSLYISSVMEAVLNPHKHSNVYEQLIRLRGGNSFTPILLDDTVVNVKQPLGLCL